MAIRITEDGVVIYENEPDIDRELFPNTPEGGGSPEQIAQAVADWFEDHPTVQDVQINEASVVTDGVANIPLMNNNVIGVAQLGTNAGTTGLSIDNNGYLYVDRATSELVKGGTNRFRPIAPDKQHESAFYGLAKAAGDTTQSGSSNAVGNYTEEAKATIQNMLGVSGIIGTVEGAVSSNTYSIGDLFLHSGALYKATTAIASGDAIVSGTNCEQTTIIDILKGG